MIAFESLKSKVQKQQVLGNIPLLSVAIGVVIGLESEYTRYAEDAGYISVCAVIKSGQIKRDVSVYLNVDERDTAGTDLKTAGL